MDEHIYLTTDPFYLETTQTSSIKFSTLVDDIMSKNILFKLSKNQSLEVDGRIIKYSIVLKNLASQCK